MVRARTSIHRSSCLFLLAGGLLLNAIAVEAWAVRFVDSTATGTGDGSSWENAYNDLQDALDAVQQGGSIWVAAGVYTPAPPDGDPTTSFDLVDGVALYGGFAGWESSLDERNWEANVTILSGDLNGNDGPGFTGNDENAYHVVTCLDWRTTAVVDGFTITGGNANGYGPYLYGGGMFIAFSTYTSISNCTFSGNRAGFGGGMHNDGAFAATLTNCAFHDNGAVEGGGMSSQYNFWTSLTDCIFSGNSAEYGGGGFINYGGYPTLAGCTFSENDAEVGGGVYNDSGAATLTDCTFNGNAATVGGAMYNGASSPTLIDCTFVANEATGASARGAGICNTGSSQPTLIHCAFIDNTAHYRGAGVYNGSGSAPTAIGCAFRHNLVTDGSGGGMSNHGAAGTLINCIFNANSADEHGGGIFNDYYSGLALTNCTFAANTASNGTALACDSGDQGGPITLGVVNSILRDGGDEVWNNDESTILITYSNVQGGWEGEGNFDADPLFVDADGPDGIPGTQDDDLHVLVSSPCVDAGHNAALPPDAVDLDGDEDTAEPIPFDPDGNPRVGDMLVDVGAYEVPGDCNGNGTPDLQDILEGASEDCDGNWTPDECQPDCNDNGLADACDIADGASEDCNGNTVPDECDMSDGTSGDCNENAVPDECDIADGGSHDCNENEIPDECEGLGGGSRLYVDANAAGSGQGVSWASALTELRAALCLARNDASVNEIWVARGTYKPADPDGDRAASFQLVDDVALYGGFGGWESSLDQRDWRANATILSGDLNGDDGPGFENIEENVYHVVTCAGWYVTTFMNGFTITGGNANGYGSEAYGGGMFIDLDVAPTVVNCTFSGNAAFFGGGVHNDAGFPTFAHCVFRRNVAGEGGGMCTVYGGESVVTNCMFNGNAVDGFGGGLANYGSAPLLSNCIFANGSAYAAGGIYNYSGNMTLVSCILWGNVDDGGYGQGAQIYGPADVDYSCIQGWNGSLGGLGNIGDAPLFADFVGPDGLEGTADDDLRLTADSPCINTGDPEAVLTPGETDLDGHARVLCDRIDMGPYEFGIGDANCDRVIDLADFAGWPDCMTAPDAVTYDAGCAAFDFDYAGDVDLADFVRFQRVFEGAGDW